MNEQKTTKPCKYCKSDIDANAKICPVCKKKQGRSGCLIAVITVIAILILGSIANSCSGKNKQPNTDTSTPVTSESQENAVTESTEDDTAPVEDIISYNSGQYKIGVDLPAGEYVIITNNGIMSYLEVSSDSTGNLDSIIANDNFSGRSYVTVSDGQYLKFTYSDMYDANNAPAVDSSNGTLPAGMYKVGVDLPAGEYKVSANSTAIEGLDAYWEISSDSSHTLSSIISNENFSGERYVTVSEGQYLKLSNCTLQL